MEFDDAGDVGREWQFSSRGTPASVESNDPRMIPAVMAALEQGLQLAPESPMWAFLPLAWPKDRCFWTPDIRVRTMTVSCDGQPATIQRWTAADYASMDVDTTEMLRQCGLPTLPAGRVWLLDTGGAAIDELLDTLAHEAESIGITPIASAAFVRFVSAKLPDLLNAR